MFIYSKIKFQFIFALILVLSFGYCNKEKQYKDESYESYIRMNTRLMCAKLLKCYTSITRTFPSELQEQVSIENCESSVLVDLDEKISLHTESMKSLSRGCYEKLLSAECKNFITFAYADTSCYMLKKESEAIYGKANKMKQEK